MRTIERTGQFKRDYKREAKGRHLKVLDALLLEVLGVLVADRALPAKNRDHALTGDWADHLSTIIFQIDQCNLSQSSMDNIYP